MPQQPYDQHKTFYNRRPVRLREPSPKILAHRYRSAAGLETNDRNEGQPPDGPFREMLFFTFEKLRARRWQSILLGGKKLFGKSNLDIFSRCV